MNHTSVFRAYDIRGVMDEDFDPAWVERLGRACGVFMRARHIEDAVVGHDCRLSSPVCHEALIRGLTASGVSVISVGMVPTPALYFAVKHLNRRAGVMITASHNPSQYNGFKIWVGESTIYGEDLQEIRAIMERDAVPASGSEKESRGVFSLHDIVPAYIDAICSRIRLRRPLHIVVDGGNGAGGEICLRVLQRLGARVTPLFCEPDGTFPNHHPDPVVEENMTALIRRVREEGADCGIGLDGDADRLGVVDRTGRLLYGDELLGIYAKELLGRHPGAMVIGDVKCSQRLFDAIAAQGGRPEMTRTGHSLIKARMRETGALLAGEMSGHMFFQDGWFGFDDGIYSAARLAGILSSGLLLEKEPGWPPAFATPEINLPCPEHLKEAIVRRAQVFFSAGHEVNTLDGARVNFGDGWGLVRASNTQPVLVTRFEAATPERLRAIKEAMLTPIQSWIEE